MKVGRDGASGAATGNGRRPSVPPSDRRRIRRDHTRLVLVDAAIDLIESGNSRPTCRQVAYRADVSVRTFFNHFHVDALLRVAAATQVTRHLVLVALVPPHGPVEVRIRVTCRQRRQFFEAVAPVLSVAYPGVPASPEMIEDLSGLHSLLQHQIAVTFGPEISSGGPDGPVLLDNLDLVTGWQFWSTLRYHRGRSATAAEHVMAFFVTRLMPDRLA